MTAPLKRGAVEIVTAETPSVCPSASATTTRASFACDDAGRDLPFCLVEPSCRVPRRLSLSLSASFNGRSTRVS